jgi:hypothetical protein
MHVSARRAPALTYQGTVRARLVQVNPLSGATETDRVHFDSGSFPSAHSLVTRN